MEYIIVYKYNGKEYREKVEFDKISNVTATQAFNKFWRQVKTKGINKNNSNIKRIVLC